MISAAAVKGPHPENLLSLIHYFERQLTKLNVRIKLGKEVDLSLVERMRPDVVFVATGGIPIIPPIPGVDRSIVISGAKLHRSGKRVVVIGGAIQGCQIAEFLAKHGRKVTIVDKVDTMGRGMVEAPMRAHLFMWFKKVGVTMIGGVKEYVEIRTHYYFQRRKNRNHRSGCHHTRATVEANMELFRSLNGRIPEVYAIGDCREPALIADAIGTGSRVARGI
jgi:pyruvate/2-oxoglutarate dehydrogenase complex dihydrolipoamide dehydrogenase (E3) component